MHIHLLNPSQIGCFGPTAQTERATPQPVAYRPQGDAPVRSMKIGPLSALVKAARSALGLSPASYAVKHYSGAAPVSAGLGKRSDSTRESSARSGVRHGSARGTGRTAVSTVHILKRAHNGPAASTSTGHANRRVFDKWTGSQRYTISSNSDQVIFDSAEINARHRKVPKENRFQLGERIGRPEQVHGANLSQQAAPLAKLTLASRLDLHGHGSRVAFEKISPRQLAKDLHRAGLRQVGVIKIQACDVGKADFLHQLSRELTKLGVKVGYISGPTAAFSDMRANVKLFGKPTTLRPFFFAPKKSVGNPFMPETFRLKVVKGNVDIAFKGTRYDTPADPAHARRLAAQTLGRRDSGVSLSEYSQPTSYSARRGTPLPSLQNMFTEDEDPPSRASLSNTPPAAAARRTPLPTLQNMFDDPE